MVQEYFSKDQEWLIFIPMDSSILAYLLIFKTHSHNENVYNAGLFCKYEYGLDEPFKKL